MSQKDDLRRRSFDSLAGHNHVAFVTGAGGFIGRHIVRALRAGGFRVVALGHGLETAVDEDCLRHVSGDITVALIARGEQAFGPPRLIVHAAGGSTVAQSIADPPRDFQRTVESTSCVLDYLKRRRGARLIFLSSAAVYGADCNHPLSEDAPLAPISPYGIHKQKAEQLIDVAISNDALDATVLRLFSVFGPGIRKQLIWELVQKLETRPQSVTLFGRGDEIRDFVSISDVVAVVMALSSAWADRRYRILNVGSGRGMMISELAALVARVMGVPTKFFFNGMVRNGDPRILVADITRTREAGFEPKNLEAGITEYVGWARIRTHEGGGGIEGRGIGPVASIANEQ